MKPNIALFAFRKSNKKLFEQMLPHCPHSTHILFSKRAFALSPKALKALPKANFEDAIYFAVEEFRIKTQLKIPRVLLKGSFRVLARFNFLRYYALLDRDFTKILLWNGGKFRQRIAREVAKILDIEVNFIENGLLPHTLVFDTQGINYDNSLPRKRSFYERYQSNTPLPHALVPRIGKNRESFRGEKAPLPDHFIFVPFQVDSDTQIIMHSPWIKNMRALFEIIEALSQSTPYHFVLKEHPSSGVKYPDLHQRATHHRRIAFHNSYSTQALIERSLAIITINSTVGVESLLFHKRVVVLGNAFYAIEGLTYPTQDLTLLEKRIKQIESLPIEDQLIDNFLKYLYNVYLIHKDKNYTKSLCERMMHRS
jgi:capsular polysaccharide export protein